jgi:hypothetical protein
MNLIQTTILNSLPAGKKKTPSGWTSFNAPCCVYNGESQDKKKRGGIMTTADGTLSYHCFNCGYKANYTIGRKLNFKMRQFMSWIGISEETVRKLAIEAMRYEEVDITVTKKRFIEFKKKELPKNSHSLDYWLEKYVGKDLTDTQYNKIDQLLNYLKSRGVEPNWYDFYYSPDQTADFNRRVIVPFYWKGDLVGYTGRLFDTRNKETKYWTETQPGYVFNIDAQDWSRKFVIVTEGPFDAITISGVSILGSEINDIQRELIEGLGKKVIVVPDRDAPGQKLIDQALEFGWGVAFPEWRKGVDDVADAVLQYGRLFTMQSILKTAETSKLKIDLKRKINVK